MESLMIRLGTRCCEGTVSTTTDVKRIENGEKFIILEENFMADIRCWTAMDCCRSYWCPWRKKDTDVGIFIGLNAACINVITEWLSDFKLGYCSQGWYLNQQFCCWQESSETCTTWKSWSSLTLISYIFYILFAVLLSRRRLMKILFAICSAFLVKAFAPYAAGSGISEIKCIIAGFTMKGFLGFTTYSSSLSLKP